MKQKIVGITEAAEIVGMDVSQLRLYARAGKVPGSFKITKRAWVFDRADLLKFAKVPRKPGPKPGTKKKPS